MVFLFNIFLFVAEKSKKIEFYFSLVQLFNAIPLILGRKQEFYVDY
jgi:hypothetical protein